MSQERERKRKNSIQGKERNKKCRLGNQFLYLVSSLFALLFLPVSVEISQSLTPRSLILLHVSFLSRLSFPLQVYSSSSSSSPSTSSSS